MFLAFKELTVLLEIRTCSAVGKILTIIIKSEVLITLLDKTKYYWGSKSLLIDLVREGFMEREPSELDLNGWFKYH